MISRSLMRLGAILLTACLAGHDANAQTVDDFSTRAVVVVPSGTAIARVALPGPSIAALRGAFGGDLRVFNAAGLSLPHAVIDASRQAPGTQDVAGERFVALPIYTASIGAGSATSAPTLRIIEGPNRRVIEVGAATTGVDQKRESHTVRGLLFDTRNLKGELRAIELEGALPPSLIVQVTLDVSADLKSWRTVASQSPVFDFGSDGPRNRRIDLPAGQKLEGQYVRLTWSDAPSLAITALRTVGLMNTHRAEPVVIELGAPQSGAEGYAEWTVMPGLRANAIRLQTSAVNALMPVHVLTRSRSGDPWRTVANTVVFRLASGGAQSVNSAQPLSSALETQVRVEALRGYSLTGVPITLALEYAPLNVLFIATGEGPFTIATGNTGAQSSTVPVTTLMPNYQSGGEFLLPTLAATVSVNQAPAQLSAAAQLFGIATQKSYLLWGVLGLAVLVLGGLAVSLLRTPKR
ncbi:MAG: DUF3999 family protein [Casimicrobium sp.]